MTVARHSTVPSPLVGRDDELDGILAALDDVVLGDGRLVLISGEPGIGKTRLAEELAALAAAEGALVAIGRVDDGDGAPPYSPWLQLLERVLDGSDRAVISDALGAGAGPISVILPAIERFTTELVTPAPLDPPAARFRLHEAIAEFLGRVGSRRPLVLILEDLHWGDVSSLELTRFVAARLRGAGVLLAVTYRDVDNGSSSVFVDVLGSLAREPGLQRVTLDGLTIAEVGLLMAQTIGVRPRRAAIAAVHARTEGNPFFVAELARLLDSDGLLGAAGSTDQADVPVGVRDVLRRRLGRLSAATTELLELGAVLGRVFDVATLADASRVQAGDVVVAIEPALEAGVITQVDGAIWSLRFSHALIRDTVYAELSASRRAKLHAQAASVLEQRNAVSGPQLAELAHHFFCAASVLGPEPALAYTLLAAEAAEGALAYELAEAGLRRALALIAQLPPGRDRLDREIVVQNQLARSLTLVDGFSASRTADAWARSRELCIERGAARELLMPLFGLFVVRSSSGDIATAAAIGVELLELGEAVGDPALMLAGHDSIGMMSFYRGDLADAALHLELSAPIAASFEHAELLTLFPMHRCGAIMELALVHFLTGDEQRSRAMLAEWQAVVERLTDPISVAPNLIIKLRFDISRGRLDTMPEDAANAAARCREWGLTAFVALAEFWGAWALQQRDGRDRTRELGDALATVERSGFRIWRTQHLGMLADALRQSGHIEQALRVVEGALVEARGRDERYWEPELLRLRGELFAASDASRVTEAIASVHEAGMLAGRQGSTTLQRRAELSLAALGSTARPGVAGRPAEGLQLSPRERELLGLVGRGLTDKQIAAELVISLATVRSHLDRIRDKTGRRRRPELTRLAVELGLAVS